MSTGRRNILVFVTDQQRHDELGVVDPRFHTPNIDAMCASGVRFDAAYASSTLCAPSRGSLITGQYPHHYFGTVPYLRTSRSLREGAWTVPRVLRHEGYATAMVGKGHYRPMYSDHGFDHMRLAEHLGQYDDAPIDDYVRWLVHNGRADHRATHMFGPDDTVEAKEFAASSGARAFQHEERYHSTSWVRDESLTFLRERDSSKPFLLVVSFPRPHAPFDPPPRWIERIDSEQFPVDSLSDSHADALPPLAQSLIRGDKGYKPVRVADLDPERVRDVLVYRAALIAQIDDAVGRLIDQVDLDETTICFTSDHGDYAGRHGLLMKTPFLPFDDLARVPFVWAGAGVAGGRVASSPVQNFDLATTMLELAGLPVLGVDGESLAAELSGAEQDPDRVVMTDSLYQYRMVRRGSLKFFRHELTREEMAFDVIDDPSETTNVVADDRYRSRVDELREELDRIMAVGIVELDVV